jgi:hypothetical protein
MRRHILRLTALIAVLLAPAASANLLSNPDFSQWDDDSTPTAWTVESRSAASVVRDAGQGHGAPPCAKLTRLQAGTGNNKGILQSIPVTAGENYTVSAWFLTPTMPDTTQYASGRVIVTWRNGSGGSIGSTNPSYVHQPVWTEQVYVATAPNNPVGDSVAASADVLIRCYGRSGGLEGGIVNADDASLVLGGAIAERPTWTDRTDLQVGPNPLTHDCRISFTMPRSDDVRLGIYDMTGSLRLNMVSGVLAKGRHTVVFDAGPLAAGLYFAVLNRGTGHPVVRKLIVEH